MENSWAATKTSLKHFLPKQLYLNKLRLFARTISTKQAQGLSTHSTERAQATYNSFWALNLKLAMLSWEIKISFFALKNRLNLFTSDLIYKYIEVERSLQAGERERENIKVFKEWHEEKIPWHFLKKGLTMRDLFKEYNLDYAHHNSSSTFVNFFPRQADICWRYIQQIKLMGLHSIGDITGGVAKKVV